MARRLLPPLVASIAVLGVGVAVWLLVPPERRPAYPPPADARSAADAQSVVAPLAVAERVGRADLAIPFAPSRTSTVELLIDGRSFYPRILDDIGAARSSVHIIQYGIRPGQVVDRFRPLLKEKVRQGVAVRLIVDQLGSGIDLSTCPLFVDLAAGGVQVVRNDPLAL